MLYFQNRLAILSVRHSTFNVNSCMMHKRRVNQFMINFQASVEACLRAATRNDSINLHRVMIFMILMIFMITPEKPIDVA